MDDLKQYSANISDSSKLHQEHLTNQEFSSTSSSSIAQNHLLTEELFQVQCQPKKMSFTSAHQSIQSPSSTSNPNDDDRGHWYQECDETNNSLLYNNNNNNLTKISGHHHHHHHNDNQTQSSRYNVKGIRNERTSFFDIPAVTTHPYCCRFSSSANTPQNILKKEPIEDSRIFSNHSTSLHHHISQHFSHHIQYPDSTTNQNHHQTLTNNNNTLPVSSISSSPPSSLLDNHGISYPYHPSYSLRSIDSSSVVSSTESDISFSKLYAGNSPITNNTLNQRRGSLQLWQFLVALLDEPSASSGCIAWTGRGMEFKLIEPEEVARRWGIQKNRPAMNYDKLSRSLRYYYEKGIMQKVAGERYVYKFVCDPEALFNMAYGGSHTTTITNTTNDTILSSPSSVFNNKNCNINETEISTTLNDTEQIKSTSSVYYNGSYHSNLK